MEDKKESRHGQLKYGKLFLLVIFFCILITVGSLFFMGTPYGLYFLIGFGVVSLIFMVWLGFRHPDMFP